MPNWTIFFAALAALASTAGCQGSEAPAPSGTLEQSQTELRYIETAPMAALFENEIFPIIRRAGIAAAQPGRMTPVSDIELLTRSEFGREWMQRGFHRAFVVGAPAAHCPYNGGSGNQATASDAILVAYRRCHEYLQRVSAALGHDCRCRVAIVDDALFMEPSELPYRELLPTLVFTLERAIPGAEPELFLRGFLDLSGRIGENQPFRLLASDGEERCAGRYNSKAPAHGAVEGRCAGLESPLIGVYQVQGFYKGRSYGVLLARSSDRNIVALFGLSEEDFTARGTDLFKYFEPRT